MKKLSIKARIVIALASVSLIGSYFLPLWRIDLWAPQYPEGLAMYIWHNRLSGDVDIINGLNHYIGMAHIKEETFPELKIIPFLVSGFAVLGLMVALIGRHLWLKVFLGILAFTGVAALADFYRWGYEYGHNLDPNAAIKVPGMSYQPPVIGYKELLNFGAYSIPDSGGWIFIFAGIIMGLVCYFECYHAKFFSGKGNKTRQSAQPIAFLGLTALALAASTGCAVDPEPIRYGKDACHSCKMTIVDNKFGCEIVTNKGKIFKFDDVLCLVRYMKTGQVLETDIRHLVVNDYLAGGQFIDVNKAWWVFTPAFRSPMNGNIAAIKSKNDKNSISLKDLRDMTWQEVYQQF